METKAICEAGAVWRHASRVPVQAASRRLLGSELLMSGWSGGTPATTGFWRPLCCVTFFCGY